MACNSDICGEWEDEQDEPTGQCKPRRLKRSCDGPAAYLNSSPQTVTIPCPEGTVGEEVSVTVEAAEVNNPFSVAAANAAALAQAQAEAEALRAATPCLYPNSEQQCTETCPEGTVGDPITVTVDAGTYTEATLEEANALALAAACAQAAALRAATPCEEFAISFSLECKSRTLNAELCGYSEFINPSGPSIPAKKYRRKDSAATHLYRSHGSNESDCIADNGIDRITTYEFQGEYNATTCVLTSQGWGVNDGGAPFEVPDFGQFTTIGDGCTITTIVNTKTTSSGSTTSPVGCCNAGSPFTSNNYYHTTYYEGLATLSIEDTEADAIARAEAFVDWEEVEWEDCEGFPCCEASHEQRTTGFTFEVQQAMVRISGAGAEPSSDVTVHVSIWRTNQDTMISELAEIQDFDVTADGSGNIQFEMELIALPGYTYYIQNVTSS